MFFLRHGLQIDYLQCYAQGVVAIKSICYDAIICVPYKPSKKFTSEIKNWRKNGINIPIVVLTEFHNVNIQIEILNAGADDCLSISVEPKEIIARIRAIQRRNFSQLATELRYGALVFDMASREVTHYGKPVQLTAREVEILELFLLHKSRLLTRSYLNDYLCSWRREINSNVIEVHISNIRRKLGHEFIETVHGQGYRLKKLPYSSIPLPIK